MRANSPPPSCSPAQQSQVGRGGGGMAVCCFLPPHSFHSKDDVRPSVAHFTLLSRVQSAIPKLTRDSPKSRIPKSTAKLAKRQLIFVAACRNNHYIIRSIKSFNLERFPNQQTILLLGTPSTSSSAHTSERLILASQSVGLERGREDQRAKNRNASLDGC